MQGQGVVNNVSGPFIISGPGQGLYIYSGTPQLGNLVQTTGLTSAGTDPTGLNHVLPGEVTYAGGIAGSSHATSAMQMNSHNLVWYDWSGSAWTSNATIANDAPASGNLIIKATSGGTGRIFLDDAVTLAGGGTASSAFAVTGGPFTATSGTVSSPTTVTTDTGSVITPSLNGWTGGTGANKVTLQPDRNVYIEIDGLAGTLASGTQITSVPAAYQPATDIRVNCATNGATAAPLNTPYVKILTTGSVQVFNLAAGTTEIFLNTVYPLF